MDSILIKNGVLATLNDKRNIIEDGAIYIEKNKIKAIGTTAELSGYKADKVIDAKGKLVMPGLVNSHMHFYSTFAQGIDIKAEAPYTFIEILERLWWKLDKKLSLDDVYYSALFPIIEGIKKGTTTFIDHHASPFHVEGSLYRIADAVKKTGVRATLCYEVSDRDGEKIRDQGIEENSDFIKNADNEMISGLFGFHASFTISDETIEKAKKSVQGIDTGYHIHTAEASSDVEDSINKYGIRVVERLNKMGLLGPKSIAVHCVHIDENEMDILKETNTTVVHNPQSNMNNAVGVADVLKMMSKGIRVGLGTDGMTANMFDEVRVAILLHKITKRDPRVAFIEPCTMLLNNNYNIANKYFNGTIGGIKEGNLADIILIDFNPPTPVNDANFLGHFIFGLAKSVVDTTIVNGRVLMENKKLSIDIDEGEISAKSKELAKKVWEQF